MYVGGWLRYVKENQIVDKRYKAKKRIHFNQWKIFLKKFILHILIGFFFIDKEYFREKFFYIHKFSG